MYFPITCDVEMVTDITESPMSDMILSASLRREGFSLWRGTAMNDNQCDGPHKFTYSFVLLSNHLQQ